MWTAKNLSIVHPLKHFILYSEATRNCKWLNEHINFKVI